MLVKVQPRRKHYISLTPLIDVVFILLVFFMLASNFTDWREYEVATVTANTPAAAASSDNPPQRLRITASGWQLGGASFNSINAVKQALRELQQQQPELSVLIQPAGDVPVQKTMDAFDAAKLLGIRRVSLLPPADSAAP